MARRKLVAEASFSYQFSHALTPVSGIIIISAYLTSYLVEKYYAEMYFDTLALRIFVTSAIALMMLRSYWITKLHSYMPLIWIVFIALILPYCFGTILINNAAYSPPGSNTNLFVVMEYVLSSFFFVQIVFHIPLILLVWILTNVVIYLQLLFLQSINMSSVVTTTLYAIPFFFTVLIVGGIINKRLFNFQREKELAVWNVANSIAHQLRTPLATIRNISSGSKNHMTDLAAGYYSGVRNGLIVAPLSNRKIDALEHSFESILNEVKHSGALIDILIANSKPFEQLEAPQNYIAIADVVTTAVEDYPYNNPTEHNLIDLDVSKNFQVNALENMILHVMFNLIANAVEFCQKRPHGRIKIWLETGEQWNKVHVWDSGNGIPKKYLHEVFDPFFSRNSPNGTGIGLSFCKSVMEGIGGKIYCASVEGQFCQFTLSFPSSAN